MKGIDRLYLGDFNVCNQTWDPDGSCYVTFFRHDEETAVTLHVRDLHGPNENVLHESVTDRRIPLHIRARHLKAEIAAQQDGR